MASRGVNKVTIIGNLGQDPDMRYMPDGSPVANLSMATSEAWKDKETGEQKEKTEWHRVVAFRKAAEIIGQYCKKGSKLYVEGKLQTRKWTDDKGIDRYTTEIIVNEFRLLSDGQRSGPPPVGDKKPLTTGDTAVTAGAAASSGTVANTTNTAAPSSPQQGTEPPVHDQIPENLADFDDSEIPF